MAEFLNKKKLLEWVPMLIETAKKELIIITLYSDIGENICPLSRRRKTGRRNYIDLQRGRTFRQRAEALLRNRKPQFAFSSQSSQQMHV